MGIKRATYGAGYLDFHRENRGFGGGFQGDLRFCGGSWSTSGRMGWFSLFFEKCEIGGMVRGRRAVRCLENITMWSWYQSWIRVENAVRGRPTCAKTMVELLS